MTAASEPTRPRLAWALREYIWLVICVIVVTGGLAAFLGGSASKDYKANALVVATGTSLSQSQLPRLASAVFNSGAVANSVIHTEHLETTPEQLIPGRVSMVPFNDTVLFQVNATGPRASDAAKLANDAATAFAEQMNAAGRFVGTFKVMVPAQEPTAPSSSPRSPAMLFFVGAIGGLAISIVGLVALVAFRRPLTSEAEIERVAQLPVLGTLFVPKHGRVDPAHVSGMRRVVRSLKASSDGARALAIVPCDGNWELSETVSQLLANDRAAWYVPYKTFAKPATNGSAKAHGTVRSEQVSSAAGAVARAESHKTPPSKRTRPLAYKSPDTAVARDDVPSPLLTIVGGFPTASGEEVPEAVFDTDARVLVVWIGASESSVARAATRFAVGEFDAIVCVDHRRH